MCVTKNNSREVYLRLIDELDALARSSAGEQVTFFRQTDALLIRAKNCEASIRNLKVLSRDNVPQNRCSDAARISLLQVKGVITQTTGLLVRCTNEEAKNYCEVERRYDRGG